MQSPEAAQREPERAADAPSPYRRVLRRSVVRTVATGTSLVVVYALVPIAGDSGLAYAALMVLGLVAFVALVGRQVKKIIGAEYPRIRAFEALALVVPVLILLFAYIYLSLSDSTPESFSEPLSRIDAAYFATTTFATVGFGDITARTESARLLVTVQMLVGLGAAVGLARLLLGAADRGLSSRDQT